MVTPEDELRDAQAIRIAVQRYFDAPPDPLDQHVGPDMLPLLPRVLGEAEVYQDLFRLAPWYLTLEGDKGRLEYTPAEMVFANWRVWFVLQVERKQGVWQVTSSGLSTGRACKLRAGDVAAGAQKTPETPNDKPSTAPVRSH